MNIEFSRQILENTQISKFMKIRPVRADSIRTDGWTDGQTDTTKLVAAFHKFRTRLKIV